MLFPKTDRVIFTKSPLVEVSCTFRFPPILSIETTAPDKFQESIRASYPGYERALNSELPDHIAKNVPPEVTNHLSVVTHQFTSEDEIWTVYLTRNRLTLSTEVYTEWSVFKQHLTPALTALSDAYNVKFFDRVGLKYQDLIVKTDLGFKREEAWNELIKAHILGELAAPEIKDSDVASAIRFILFKLPEEKGYINLKHGLAHQEDSSEFPESAYLIDFEFYSRSKTEMKDVNKTIDDYNRGARDLFRWCITEKLYQALGPVAT